MARKNFDWFLKGQWLCANMAIYDHDVTYYYGMGLQILPISYIIKRLRYDMGMASFRRLPGLHIYSRDLYIKFWRANYYMQLHALQIGLSQIITKAAIVDHVPVRSLSCKTRLRRMIFSWDSAQAFSVRRPTSLR